MNVQLYMLFLRVNMARLTELIDHSSAAAAAVACWWPAKPDFRLGADNNSILFDQGRF